MAMKPVPSKVSVAGSGITSSVLMDTAYWLEKQSKAHANNSS
jgi:hypothetical protein